MREVLYDVKWQKLRISMLQKRHAQGGWATLAGVQDNLMHLNAYLYEPEISKTEQLLRQYRVNNCLNAVVMGYGSQSEAADRAFLVREFRDLHTDVRIFGQQARMHGTGWNWRKVQDDIKKLLTDEERKFLYQDLSKRSKNGTDRTRPELYTFLAQMRLVGV